MVLWDTSPPLSLSAGFPNKVTIPCPNNLSLDLLACRAVGSMSLDSVTQLAHKVGESALYTAAFCFLSVKLVLKASLNSIETLKKLW